MEKHLLVTISEQKSAWHGIRFVEKFFSNKETLKLTLLYNAPISPVSWEVELTYDTEIQERQLTEQYEVEGKTALDGARKQLIGAGFNKENIDTKLQTRKF